MAQLLVSAAHTWAMQEVARLRVLAREEGELGLLTTRLEAAWDRDRSCTTLAELGTHHPEYRALIAAWADAGARARTLSLPVQPDVTALDQAKLAVQERRLLASAPLRRSVRHRVEVES
jgi:hypothetical protein